VARFPWIARIRYSSDLCLHLLEVFVPGRNRPKQAPGQSAGQDPHPFHYSIDQVYGDETNGGQPQASRGNFGGHEFPNRSLCCLPGGEEVPFELLQHETVGSAEGSSISSTDSRAATAPPGYAQTSNFLDPKGPGPEPRVTSSAVPACSLPVTTSSSENIKQ